MHSRIQNETMDTPIPDDLDKSDYLFFVISANPGCAPGKVRDEVSFFVIYPCRFEQGVQTAVRYFRGYAVFNHACKYNLRSDRHL